MLWNTTTMLARQKIGPGVKYLGVVKADAYGHGAVQVARKLEQLGADYLAVSSLDEGRGAAATAASTMPILILGHTPPEMVSELHANTTSRRQCPAKAKADWSTAPRL